MSLKFSNIKIMGIKFLDNFFELAIHKPHAVNEVLSKLSLPLYKLPDNENELSKITFSSTANKVSEILGLNQLKLIESVRQTFITNKIALIVWHATNSVMWSYIRSEGLLPYNENRILTIFRKEISKIHEVGKSDKMWKKFLADTDSNSYHRLRRNEKPRIYFHVDRRIFKEENERAVGIKGPEGYISFHRNLIEWSMKNNISTEKLILYLKDPEKHEGVLLKCYLTPEILGELEWKQVAKLVLEFAVAIKIKYYYSPSSFSLYRKLPRKNIVSESRIKGIIPFNIISGKPVNLKFQKINFTYGRMGVAEKRERYLTLH